LKEVAIFKKKGRGRTDTASTAASSEKKRKR